MVVRWKELVSGSLDLAVGTAVSVTLQVTSLSLCTSNAGDYPSQGGGLEKMSIKLVAHSREQFL